MTLCNAITMKVACSLSVHVYIYDTGTINWYFCKLLDRFVGKHVYIVFVNWLVLQKCPWPVTRQP